MSRFDGQRLNNRTFQLDVERLRRAWYADKYFWNIADTLRQLALRGYRFAGQSPVLERLGIRPEDVDVGNLCVEMQFFTRRQPYALVCGVDRALATLRHCTGYYEGETFVDTHHELVTFLTDRKLSLSACFQRYIAFALQGTGCIANNIQKGLHQHI